MGNLTPLECLVEAVELREKEFAVAVVQYLSPNGPEVAASFFNFQQLGCGEYLKL